jgi:HEPN domain-containing protein
LNFKEFTNNEETFNKVMSEIDAEMKADGIAIPARSIHGGMRVSKRFNCSISWEGAEGKRINHWFDLRYGDAMKVDFSPGSTVVFISGDIYEAKFPMISGFHKVNPFHWIKKVTPQILNSLIPSELEKIATTILDAFESFQYLKFLPQECVVDLKTAVDHLVRQVPEYGLSQWASLQAAEKTLKAYINKKGQKAQNIHDLSKLAAQAESLGLPPVDPNCIKSTQCSPGVRYDVPVTSAAAVDAYHCATKICEHVSRNF